MVRALPSLPSQSNQVTATVTAVSKAVISEIRSAWRTSMYGSLFWVIVNRQFKRSSKTFSKVDTFIWMSGSKTLWVHSILLPTRASLDTEQKYRVDCGNSAYWPSGTQDFKILHCIASESIDHYLCMFTFICRGIQWMSPVCSFTRKLMSIRMNLLVLGLPSWLLACFLRFFLLFSSRLFDQIIKDHQKIGRSRSRWILRIRQCTCIAASPFWLLREKRSDQTESSSNRKHPLY